MKRFILMFSIIALGAFVVKGVTSITPSIKVGNETKITSDYSCDLENVVIMKAHFEKSRVENPINLECNLITVDKAEKRNITNVLYAEVNCNRYSGEYFNPPDKTNYNFSNITLNKTSNTNRTNGIKLSSSGGMPYVKNLISMSHYNDSHAINYLSMYKYNRT